MTAARGGFWLQPTTQKADEAVAFADALEASPAGRPGVSFGPAHTHLKLNDFFQHARARGDAVFDAHGHLLDRDHGPQMSERYPWLTLTPRPTDQAGWEAWMRESLQHQRSSLLRGDHGRGPSFLMTPSPILTPTGGAAELHQVLDAAHAVRADVPPTTECWMCVTVARDYVMNTNHLTALLNALLAAQPTGVVFRAPQTELVPVTITGYLVGFREVVQALSSNGIDVFLPNTGWLGWLSMGWGAWGFSGGLSAGSWADRNPSPANSPAVPSNYYFETGLLRPIKWALHEDLVQQPAYDPCPCPECARMGTQYNEDLAKRHQIRMANAAGAELNGLAMGDRPAVVRGRLAAAIAYRDGLPGSLADRADSRFLDVWESLA